jgi:hypothetical protein
MRARIAATLFAAAVLIAGCGPGDHVPSPSARTSASPDPMAAGTCFNPTADAPEPSVAVPCNRAHRFEMLARQDLPLEYFGNSAPTLADRARLQAALDGKTTGGLQLKFATYAHAYCTIALQRLTGLAEAQFGKEDPATVQATVHRKDSVAAAYLNAGAAWLHQPLLLCANRFVHPATAALTAGLLTSAIPTSSRSCFDIDAAGRQRTVPCDRPHDGETALDFDATPLLDPDQLATATADPERPLPSDVQDVLDAACQATLPTVIGDGYDEAHVTAQATRAKQGWGRGGYVNFAVCQFVATKGAARLPAGSLIGAGDRTVQLIVG